MSKKLTQEEIDKLFFGEAVRIYEENHTITDEEWKETFSKAEEGISKENKFRVLTQEEIDELFERVKKTMKEKKDEGDNIISKGLTQEETEKLFEDAFGDLDKGNTITITYHVELDALTGCRLSKLFPSEFDDMLTDAEKNYIDVTLALIDLDHFKKVNDTFGHKIGDDVLAEIGKILLDIDANKSVYRYGGEEFAILFPNMEKEQAFLLLDRVRDNISKAEECKKTSTTVSIGIATYAEDGTRQVDLVRKADGALYRAKTTGRNRVCLAKEEKLVTKTVHFTVEQLKRLRELSDSVSIGEAALLREALDDLLKKYNEKKKLEPTVLIVDDAMFMRMMLKDIVTKNGFKVVGEAADGVAGLELFKDLNPDFVLLDINMPNMDGITFLKNIEKTSKNQIIMVSAVGHPSYVKDSFQNGADAFVLKPFQADRIISVLHNTEKYSVPKDCIDKFVNSIPNVDILSQAQIDDAVEKSKR